MIINDKEKTYLIKDKIYYCGIHATMSMIGGKWKCIILWYLRHGEIRFSKLARLMPSITEKMLSLQLQALELDRFVNRKVEGDKPPLKVTYSLTDLGKTLLPIVSLINSWGDDYAEQNGVFIEK